MTDEETPSEEEQPKQVVPWIKGYEAHQRFGHTGPKLMLMAKTKKIRSKNINGQTHYSVEDLENYNENSEENSVQETSMADLVRAARDMLAVAQTHQEKMFDKYMGAFDKLLKSSADAIDKQNEHIIDLEKQALLMREATEKVFNLEHERKLSELKEERTRNMQSKALEMLQKTVAPWVMSKLGDKVPPVVQPTADAPDPRLAQLGQAVIGMIGQMSDEQFQMLGKLIGTEEFQVLSMIRESMKGSS